MSDLLFISSQGFYIALGAFCAWFAYVPPFYECKISFCGQRNGLLLNLKNIFTECNVILSKDILQ